MRLDGYRRDQFVLVLGMSEDIHLPNDIIALCLSLALPFTFVLILLSVIPSIM